MKAARCVLAFVAFFALSLFGACTMTPSHGSAEAPPGAWLDARRDGVYPEHPVVLSGTHKRTAWLRVDYDLQIQGSATTAPLWHAELLLVGPGFTHPIHHPPPVAIEGPTVGSLWVPVSGDPGMDTWQLHLWTDDPGQLSGRYRVSVVEGWGR